jgi:hypothetical protein
MSNGESNSIYTSNMARMGAMLGERKAFDVTDNVSIYDSDDEPIDDQEALGRKVSLTFLFFNTVRVAELEGFMWILTAF